MGASKSGLRPMESRQSSRIRLPNGDDLPCHMEDAPIDRIPEDQSYGPSATKSARSGRKIDRESVRRSPSSILPIREVPSRRITGSVAQKLDQGSNSRRSEDYSCGGPNSVPTKTEASAGISDDGTTGRTTEERPLKIDGSRISISSGKEETKNCFLDKTRSCGSDCMAFDIYWKIQPCSLLRAFKPTTALSMPSPPKVKP